MQARDLYTGGLASSGSRYPNFQPQDNTKYAARADAYPTRPTYAPRPQPTAPPAYPLPRYDVRPEYTAPVYADESWKVKRQAVESSQPSLWSMTAEQIGSPAAYFASPLDVKRALSVAGEFTWHYFHLMQTQPEMLHCFYCRDSQLAHGSSVWPHENWHRAIGEAEIGHLFDQILKSQLEQQGSVIIRSNVKTLEAQPTRDDGIVMQATGIIETRDMGDRAFAHTIVMKKTQDAGSYVVLHDIFVFLDDINQAPLAAQPAFVPSSVQPTEPAATSPDYPSTRTPAVTETAPVDVTPLMPIPTGRILQSSSSVAEETGEEGGSAGPVEVEPEPSLEETPVEVKETETETAMPVPPVEEPVAEETPLVPVAIVEETREEPESLPEVIAETETETAEVAAEKDRDAETETTKEERSEGVEKSTTGVSPWKPIARQKAETGIEESVKVETEETAPKIENRISVDMHSYAGKVMQGVRNIPAKRGVVLKRRDEIPASTGEDSASLQMASKTVWVSQMDGVSNTQIENAVMYRLRGCPVEGRVIRIERMRNGPAGVIELDSPECVPLLLERGLCINGRDVRVDLYKQSPSQISREPKSAPREKKDAPRSAPRPSRPPTSATGGLSSSPGIGGVVTASGSVPASGGNRNWQRRGPNSSTSKPRNRKSSAEGVEEGWEVAQRRKGSSRVAVARN